MDVVVHDHSVRQSLAIHPIPYLLNDIDAGDGVPRPGILPTALVFEERRDEACGPEVVLLSAGR